VALSARADGNLSYPMFKIQSPVWTLRREPALVERKIADRKNRAGYSVDQLRSSRSFCSRSHQGLNFRSFPGGRLRQLLRKLASPSPASSDLSPLAETSMHGASIRI
jgi:hypothetical protein